MQQSTILAISLFFHLLATVIWIGGLIITTTLIWPEMRRTLENTPALFALLKRLRMRFITWGNLSLAVLIFTGLTQMAFDENYDGLLDFSNQWSKVIFIKHIVIIGMVISGAILQYATIPALERTSLLIEHGKSDPSVWDKLRKQEIRLTQINVFLGICVLAFSAWAGTL